MSPAPANRREFLRDCARYPLLVGLGVLGVTLAGRRGDPASAAPCVKARVCRDCAAFAGCALPEAKAARQEPL